MKKHILFWMIYSTFLQAGTVVSFKSTKVYYVEGTLMNEFFVFNEETNNEQRILLKSNKNMVDGAQYAVCIQMIKNCHMECTGKIIGRPKFITPNIAPALLISNSRGAFEPTDKTQCP